MEEDNIKHVYEEKVDKEEDNAEDIHGEFVVVDDDDNNKLRIILILYSTIF